MSYYRKGVNYHPKFDNTSRTPQCYNQRDEYFVCQEKNQNYLSIDKSVCQPERVKYFDSCLKRHIKEDLIRRFVLNREKLLEKKLQSI